MEKGVESGCSKHLYQLSVYPETNALNQNAPHNNYQNSYMFFHATAILMLS